MRQDKDERPGMTLIKRVEVEGQEVTVWVDGEGKFSAEATSKAGAVTQAQGTSMKLALDDLKQRLRVQLTPIPVTFFRVLDRWNEDEVPTTEDGTIVGRHSRSNALLLRNSKGESVKEYGAGVTFITRRLTQAEIDKLIGLLQAKRKAVLQYDSYKESVSLTSYAVTRLLAGDDLNVVLEAEGKAKAERKAVRR